VFVEFKLLHWSSDISPRKCPQLLPDFKDFATQQTAGGQPPSDAFMTYCAREFMHVQWEILLDEEFLEAWLHGIVILCSDGVYRRFYPRIFIYCADYPEK
jgi:hypothetical protein